MRLLLMADVHLDSPFATSGWAADVARERQVILFSQEEQVRTWAEANLGGRVAAVHRLDDDTAT